MIAQLSMNQLSTCRWSLDEDVHHYANAGFRHIGLWRRKVDDFGLERTAEILADHRLSASHLAWAGGFTGNCGNGWQDGIEDASRAIRDAAFLQAPALTVFAGGRNSHTSRHARRLLDSALDGLIGEAAVHEVTLALKPVHPAFVDEWSFLTRLQDAAAVVEEFDSPWLKLCVDTYHFSNLGAKPALIERIAPLTAVLQMGDSSTNVSREQYRCNLGEGIVPNQAIVDAFVAAGYAGAIDVKLFGAARSSQNYDDLLAHALATTSSWTGVGAGVA